MRVPPPTPVYASGGSDSLCSLHSPPGKLHMEGDNGPKYKLAPLAKAWVSFPCWCTESPLRRAAEGSTPCAPAPQTWLCSAPAPPPGPAPGPPHLVLQPGSPWGVLGVMVRQWPDPRPLHPPCHNTSPASLKELL